jgi:hypothetical protein
MEGGTALVVSGQVTGVSVHSDGGEASLRYVRLQRRGNEVIVRGQGTATDPQDLLKQVGTRVPLVLSLLTPRCLHRVLRRAGPLEELVPLAFPGVSLDQVLAAGWNEDGSTGVSMMRKEHAEPIMSALRDAGFRVIDAAPGPWPLLQLRALLHPEGMGDATIGGHTFPSSDGALSAYVPPTDESGTTTIGTDTLADTHLLAFAIAWAHLLPNGQRSVLAVPAVLHDQREERARLWYERGSLILAALLLLLLGVDAGLGSQLDASRSDPSATMEGRAALQAELEHLRSTVKARETLAVQLGLTRTEPFALRASRVLDGVPSGILLDRMTMDPLVEGLRQRERPAVIDRRIRIQGSCPDGQVFHAWMNTLRAKQGILSVRLISFKAETSDKRPTFEIELET